MKETALFHLTLLKITGLISILCQINKFSECFSPVVKYKVLKLILKVSTFIEKSVKDQYWVVI